MNKYQESLDVVKEDIMKLYNGVESSINKAQIRYENECEPMIDDLQQLVNLHTPMKVERLDLGTGTLKCPKCGCEMPIYIGGEYPYFCVEEDCGQSLCYE